MKSHLDDNNGSGSSGSSPAPWDNVTRSLIGVLQVDLLKEKLQGLNLDIQVADNDDYYYHYYYYYYLPSFA